MWGKMLVVLGAGCGIYACVELARLIIFLGTIEDGPHDGSTFWWGNGVWRGER